MPDLNWKLLSPLALIACFCAGTVECAPATGTFAEKTFSAPAAFTADGSPLATKNAFAVLTDQYFSGRTMAVEILLTPDPMPDALRQALQAGDDTALRGKNLAYLILFIDKSNQIWQVNLTVVLPGKTVAQTIAWRPEELKRFASNYSFDGSRLKLKSKGSYPEQTPATLTWEVNLDLPVLLKKSANKK